ncbi:MAG TPA: diguanylate cyclase [Polyangiaceae bacterium]|nr:diguanylate cyclase [Polyangiaceae bacterium]
MITILLVDDDVPFCERVASALEGVGYRVVRARSGVEASAALGAERPDLLVVGGVLADGPGIKWVAGLGGRSAPVLFVSSFWRDLQSITQLRAFGVSLVVYKPVDPAVFLEQVNGLLSGPPPSSSAEERAFEARLTALRVEYARSLPAQLARLEALLAPGAAAGAEARHEARQMAHALRGTAGSCGLMGVADAAARLEAGLGPAPPPGGRGLGEALGALRREVAAALGRWAPAGAAEGSPRLLVASAEPGLREAAGRVARRLLVATYSYDEGPAAFAGAAPDLALLDGDLTPPGLAFEVARRLRSLPGGETLPLAFVAERAELDERLRAAHVGASLFLGKPVDDNALEAALRQLLAQRESEQPHVLIVDGDAEFCRVVAEALGRHRLRVTSLAEPAGILEALEEARPDLLLLDVVLEGVSGFDVCRMLRAMPRWQGLPVLFLTSKSGLESRVAAFRAGADDYLMKPVVEDELLARIRVRIERSRLLRERADKDVLTGLLTRRTFLEQLGARLAEARRHGRPLALCMLDIDRFKSVNDTHGHLAGDQVLVGLGQLLSRRFRREDLRGRWGGEEFVLAFPGEGTATAGALLERVRGEFREMAFAGAGGAPFHATLSAGIAGFPEDGATAEELLRSADLRLYAAKRAGRDRVVAAGDGG